VKKNYSEEAKWYRKAFQLSIPLFLVAVTISVASDTDSDALVVAVAVIFVPVAVIFVGVVLAGALLLRAIELEVQKLASGTK